MTKTFIIGLQCLILSTAVSLYAQRGERGAPQAPRPDNAQSLAHINAAKKLAADDSFLANPNNFFCVAGNARAQNNNAPDLDPVKLFDNVYAVGNSETTVYALTSSEGIVLLDAGFENKAESVLVPQLQKLGLDPAKVKYILLGHGHADHFGGSKYFQDKYGTKICNSNMLNVDVKKKKKKKNPFTALADRRLCCESACTKFGLAVDGPFRPSRQSPSSRRLDA